MAVFLLVFLLSRARHRQHKDGAHRSRSREQPSVSNGEACRKLADKLCAGVGERKLACEGQVVAVLKGQSENKTRPE